MHNSSMAAKRLKTPNFCCSFHVTPAQDSLKVSLLKTGKHRGRLCHQLLTQTKQNSKSPRAGAAAGLTHGVTGLSTACCKQGCLPPQQTATGDNIQRYHPCRAGTAGLAACKGMDCFRSSGFHKFPLHTLSYAQSRIIQLL